VDGEGPDFPTHKYTSSIQVISGFGVRCRRIAAAGRSEKLLRAVVECCGPAQVHVIPNVDVKNDISLVAMAQRARLVLNCVGPYRHFGEPVVKACVATGTDYMDVCGEPGMQCSLLMQKMASGMETINGPLLVGNLLHKCSCIGISCMH
jgi:short subunit dehydrogenase-like uncharacterized protein